MKFMKKSILVIAISLPVLLSLSNRSPAIEKPALNLTPEDMAKLEKGEMILRIEEFQKEGGGRGARTNTYNLMNAAPEAVWSVLYQPDKDSEWAPRLEISEITGRGENFIDIHYALKTPVKLFHFYIHREYHKNILLIKSNLKKDEKNDLDTVDGLYVLYPVDGGKKTIMFYSLNLVASSKIPKVIMDYFTMQGCKEWMENLKKRVESGGTWKRPS